jgi:hypothetical protein
MRGSHLYGREGLEDADAGTGAAMTPFKFILTAALLTAFLATLFGRDNLHVSRALFLRLTVADASSDAAIAHLAGQYAVGNMLLGLWLSAAPEKRLPERLLGSV